MIKELLKNLWFSEREAKIYLAGLETGLAPASKIAKQAGEKRVTCYQILESMWAKGRLLEVKKNSISQYEMIAPWELTKLYESKLNELKLKVPEMVWLMNQYASKPKVQYFEGREQLKDLFIQIVDSGKSYSKEQQCFLTFLWAIDVDPEFAQWLESDFKPYRLESPAISKSLIAEGNHAYLEYTMKYHDFRLVKDPVFELSNEIVMYDRNKVALLMYNADELSGVVIESSSFHQALSNIFYTIWNLTT